MVIQVDDFVTDRKNAFYGVRLAIKEAVKQGADTLQFGSGEYHFAHSIPIDTRSIAHDDGCGDIHRKDCHILLQNINNLTLCGSDGERTILTGFNSGKIQELLPSLLWAENCGSLRVKDLCFSRSPQTAFSGVVERIEEDTVFIRILSSKETPEELGAYCMNRYDIRERKLLGESLTYGFGYENRFYRTEGQEYRLTDKNIADKLKTGEGLSFHQSGKTDFLLFFGNCRDLKLENIQVENTNGFALLTENCEHITADKVKIAPSENQFFTGPRDGWKIYRCSGEIKVENSHFEGVRMDGQNVQSNYLIVEKILDEKTLLCKCKYAPIPLKNNTPIYFREEEPERVLHIENWNLEKGHMEEAKQAEGFSAGAVVSGSRNHISFYRIEIKEPLPLKITEGTLLTAGCWEPEMYLCRNSVFRNIAGAGQLIRCRNVVLEGNIYENIMCAGIMLGAEFDTHCESDHVSNVLIRSNYFRNIGTKPRYGIYGCACIGIKSQGFQGPFNKNIRIENNRFEQSNRAIEINDAKDVIIRNNTYEDIKENIRVDETSSLHIVGKEEER